MDRCTQFALHPLRNVKSVQLVVQEMAEPWLYFRVLLTTRAAVFSTRWSLSVVDLDAPPRMALQ